MGNLLLRKEYTFGGPVLTIWLLFVNLTRWVIVEVWNPKRSAENVTIKIPIHHPWPRPNAVRYQLTRLLLTGISSGPYLMGNASQPLLMFMGFTENCTYHADLLFFSCFSFKRNEFLGHL